MKEQGRYIKPTADQYHHDCLASSQIIILSPVQNCRKFSTVFGTISLNNSTLILPAGRSVFLYVYVDKVCDSSTGIHGNRMKAMMH